MTDMMHLQTNNEEIVRHERIIVYIRIVKTVHLLNLFIFTYTRGNTSVPGQESQPLNLQMPANHNKLG